MGGVGILFMCCCRLPQMYTAIDLFTAVWNLYDESLNGIHSLRQKSEEDGRGILLSRQKWLVVSVTLVWLLKDSIFLSPQLRLVSWILLGTFFLVSASSGGFCSTIWLDKKVRNKAEIHVFIACLFKIYFLVPICPHNISLFYFKGPDLIFQCSVGCNASLL